jgi:putative SOS response-associated peptidase YedK
MCGRFTLQHSPEEVAQRFAVQQTLFDFPQRYNIAPMQPVAVVTQNAHGDGVRALEGYRWGLVPTWAKDDSIGSKMINARVETLSEKASFKHALKRRRCLIPADGFYEWKQEDKAKTPHYIHFRDNRLWAFAGLWEEWNGPGDAPLRTCTIITGPPNPLLATLHHRMAVILPPDLESVWLDPGTDMEEALSLLKTFPDTELEAFPIGKRVGNVVNDDAGLIERVEVQPEPGSEQLSLL